MADDYRKLRHVRFYKDRVNVGVTGYNPDVTLYYNGSDELIKVKETWRGEIWEQTISGTTSSGVYMDQVVDHETCFDSWIKV